MLQGERDPAALIQGLETEAAVNMVLLLGRLQDEKMGQMLANTALLLTGMLRGDAQAREAAQPLIQQLAQAEDETARKFGRALQALLEGERDPDRLLAGWGDDIPLL